MCEIGYANILCSSRGQHSGSNPGSYEAQARTPSSTSITTESHFHSLDSPLTDKPDLSPKPPYSTELINRVETY